MQKKGVLLERMAMGAMLVWSTTCCKATPYRYRDFIITTIIIIAATEALTTANDDHYLS